MNRQEFEDTARRYREELFRMYAGQNMNLLPKPPKNQCPAPLPVPPKPPQNEQSAVTAMAISAPEEPEPAVSAERSQEETAAPVLPKRAYTGIIRVHVATAQGARPVDGASVIISQMTDGEPELISLQTTDQSGNIEAVTVPAPPPSADQRRPASFLYDITAQAAGYYREHSTDVPVFPNITSVQNFDMIPLPAGADDPLPDGDITFYNDMQQY